MVDKVEWRIIHIIVQMRTLLVQDFSSTWTSQAPIHQQDYHEKLPDNEYETAEVLSENLVF